MNWSALECMLGGEASATVAVHGGCGPRYTDKAMMHYPYNITTKHAYTSINYYMFK